MAVLPGVLGCRTLRRTVKSTPRIQPPAVARWHSHLRGLATAIHEISGPCAFMLIRRAQTSRLRVGIQQLC
ncbi:MAG: hypothetical protein WBG91_04615 [Syntrophobacteria bacterium]